MKHIAGGLGGRAGCRTDRLKVPKAELLELIAALHERGLGSHRIAELIGYARSGVSGYMSDMGLHSRNPRHAANAIIKHLPPELEARVLRVKLKSDAAHARAWARVNGEDVSRRTHVLSDKCEEMVPNMRDESRPQETEPA